MKSRATWLLFIAAVLIFVVYGAAERLGLRETTSLLTRMDVLSDPPLADAAGLVLFLTSYALALFVAPVLLIAAVLNEIFARLHQRRGGKPPSGARAVQVLGVKDANS